MEAVLRFFVRYAPLVYMLLAMGLVFGIHRLVQARAAWREAIYGLERELASRRTVQAVTTLTLIGVFALAEMVLVVFLAPNVPALSLIGTPTLNPIALPTETLSAEFLATPAEAIPGEPPPLPLDPCIPGQIAITSPKALDELRGQVRLEGSADIPNFGFYKYEFAPQGSDNWTTVQANRTPVRDGELGSWDTSEIVPGDYLLRLVVTDNQGNALPACVLPVRILAP